MRRTNLETLCTALLTTVVLSAPLACDSSAARDRGEPATNVATSQTQSQTATADRARQSVAPSVAPAPAIDEPVLASAVGPIARPSALAAQPEAEVEVAPALERRERPADSLRSPTLLPADTAEANVAAFTHLPIAKRDKAPIAGAGATGIHLDELEVGKGWASSRCEDLDTAFVAGVDARVNVCFRVVHPREAETVTLEWSRAGKVRQTIDVRVAPTHAYLTRAWLPVGSGRAGDWTATIKSEDGAVLGAIEFEITTGS